MASAKFAVAALLLVAVLAVQANAHDQLDASGADLINAVSRRWQPGGLRSLQTVQAATSTAAIQSCSDFCKANSNWGTPCGTSPNGDCCCNGFTGCYVKNSWTRC